MEYDCQEECDNYENSLATDKCRNCGKEYDVVSEYSVCGDCFNGCCDPSHHKNFCDGSC